MTSSSINPSFGGFNNPMYPYFEPPFMSTSPQKTYGSGDDDTELLRKYGLDQLTLEDNTAMKKTSTISGPGHASSAMGQDSAEATRSNWTTFE